MSVNPDSPTWKAVEAWAKDEIAKCHELLEHPHDMQVTSTTRGRIVSLRMVLDLGDKARNAAAREGQPAKPTPNDYA